jgi:hypothetical protein
MTLAAGLSSGGLFAIWAALAIAAALLVRKVRLCETPKLDDTHCPMSHPVGVASPAFPCQTACVVFCAYVVFWRLVLTTVVLLQVQPWAQAPLAAALATPVSLLMINGALSYNTHVLDKAGFFHVPSGGNSESRVCAVLLVLPDFLHNADKTCVSK